MTHDERVRGVAALGFSERQASFLVTAMLHSGVFLRRQYCASAGIARGQRVHEFLERLIKNGHATSYRTAHRAAFIYHVHGKRLYRAIGDPDNRHRRPVTLARAIERLMLLDAVLDDRSTRWLATERDKVDHFTKIAAVRLDALPRLTFGRPPDQVFRYFPDKLPIGVASDGVTYVFVYCVTRESPIEFRGFLHRHAELLRSVRAWDIRLLVPPHVAAFTAAFELAAQEEMAQPLQTDAVADLRWYFDQRRLTDSGRPAQDPARFEALRRSFDAQRYRALYRSWQVEGAAPLYGATSPVLGDALAVKDGRVTPQLLPHSYLHLAPLVGTA